MQRPLPGTAAAAGPGSGVAAGAVPAFPPAGGGVSSLSHEAGTQPGPSGSLAVTRASESIRPMARPRAGAASESVTVTRRARSRQRVAAVPASHVLVTLSY